VTFEEGLVMVFCISHLHFWPDNEPVGRDYDAITSLRLG
jgi:hypothetical protein